MPRPAYRAPQTSLGALTPAPDTGVPFGQKPPPTRQPPRAGHQLGHRVPQDLWQRMLAVVDRDQIPMGRLITVALEAEVARREELPDR